MSDKKIRQEMLGLDVRELRRTQLATGRKALDPDFVRAWADVHERTREWLDDERTGPRVRRTAALLSEITYSLWVKNEGQTLTYYPYTDVQVIQWFIGPTHTLYRELKERALRGVFYMLRDMGEFESDSLGAVLASNRERFNGERVLERLKEIAAARACLMEVAREIAPALPLDDMHDLIHHTSVEDYAEEALRLSALVHFTAIPQTQFHDEVLFQRTIHVTELCLFGARVALMEALENLKRSRLGEGAACLRHATLFSELLWESFKILKTMPPEHFIDFRDDTEHSSAVQSRNYQLLDIYLRGVDDRREKVYREVDHLKPLLRFAHPGFVHLSGLLRIAPLSSAEWKPVEEEARRLDRALLTWRGMHLGFAINYLADIPVGTGGTSGVPYLKAFHRSGIFSETTVDLDRIRSVFPEFPDLDQEARLTSDQGVGPAVRKRASRKVRPRREPGL